MLFGALEVGLRVVWRNPYGATNHHHETTRLHVPSPGGHARADGLYEGAGEVRLAVDSDYAIGRGSSPRPARCVALGGSTTESALVPEGSRWPDLLDWKNYGVSANDTVDSYFNLHFLLGNVLEGEAPCVAVMEAINDLGGMLHATPLSVERRPSAQHDVLQGESKAKLLGVSVRQSALIAYFVFSGAERNGRFFLPQYVEKRREQGSLPSLAPADAQAFRDDVRARFLPARAEMIRKIDQMVKERRGTLILVTQPNAYRSDYRPFETDLRLVAEKQRRVFSLEATGELLQEINDQTLALARELGRPSADVATCFRAKDPGPLFYDSIHLTPAGSRAVAECVRKSVPEWVDPGAPP